MEVDAAKLKIGDVILVADATQLNSQWIHGLGCLLVDSVYLSAHKKLDALLGAIPVKGRDCP